MKTMKMCKYLTIFAKFKSDMFIGCSPTVLQPYLLLVSFFWLVGVVAQLTFTSCREGQRKTKVGYVCIINSLFTCTRQGPPHLSISTKMQPAQKNARSVLLDSKC